MGGLLMFDVSIWPYFRRHRTEHPWSHQPSSESVFGVVTGHFRLDRVLVHMYPWTPGDPSCRYISTLMRPTGRVHGPRPQPLNLLHFRRLGGLSGNSWFVKSSVLIRYEITKATTAEATRADRMAISAAPMFEVLQDRAAVHCRAVSVSHHSQQRGPYN